MAVINLAEAKIIQTSAKMPLVWSADRSISEPTFDYDDEGNPQDFEMDDEPPDPTMEELSDIDLGMLLYNVSPSQFAETAIRVPEAGRVADFLFDGREYLRKIYDTSADKVLLKCGRQVEKSCQVSDIIRLSDGSPRLAGDVVVGDRVASMDVDGTSMTNGRVTWVSQRYMKPCVRVKTRQGHETVLALTHPLRTWNAWTEAGELTVGARVAVVRRCGEFSSAASPELERIRLTAYMLGDGGVSGATFGFTAVPGPGLDEFLSDITKIGGTYKKDTTKGEAYQVRIHRNCVLYDWLEYDGLAGTHSGTKFVPKWVFGLSKDDTALFLNRLWSTDGHVKQNGPAKYSIEYCSTSKRLVKDVQALLWKFGIPTRIRKNWPNYWKKKGVKKYAWILRVETREGILVFLEDVACIGKSEDTPLPEEGSNNNRDTLPAEINELIRQIIKSRGTEDRYGRFADKSKSLRTAGLRETLKYPPTFEKIGDYVYFFRQDDRYDQSLVDELEKHLFTDLYWDRIVEIKDVGMQECVDFSVECTESFVEDGFISHNSTTLGNRLLCYSALTNNFRSLFVAPSAEQAKVFSTDRIKDVVEASPLLKAYTTTKISQAVFFKKFINFSQIRLRYAYLTADRVRGIPADLVCYDRNAEVLTKKGWVRIKELKGDELIADVSGGGTVYWHKPSRVFSKRHTGEMVTFNHAGMSLRVTGDHNMWVNYRVKESSKYKTPDRWEFARAADLARTDHMGFKMTCAADWQRETVGVPLRKFREWTVEQKVSNQYGFSGKTTINTYPGLEMPYDAFASVVGWYLAEGHIQRGQGDSPLRRPVITQNPGDGLDAIVQALEDCGLDYNIIPTKAGGRRITINSQILGEYFEPLGSSYDKYIPREFFDYPELLVPLLKGLWGGDAMYHPGEEWDEGTLRTRSRELAEDAQEAWLRLGRPAVIHTRMMRPVASNGPNAGADVDPLPMYEVCAYKRDYSIFWRAEFDSKERVVVEQVKDEEVYCFTVEFHRPIVKGGFGQKPVISGQCIDEIQDILVDNIPVIEQCAFHSKFKLFLYSGTPKSMDNTLEHYWTEFSTQNEWVVPCERHGTPKDLSSWHWNILGEKSIGKLGLICDKCGAPISAKHPQAQWVSINPREEGNKDKVTFDGYRIPQIMVQWVDWDDILQAQEQYSRAQFMNEKLGMSYDSGVRPITRAQLKACCRPEIRLPDIEEFKRIAQGRQIYAGVDWGTGEGSSFTVMSLGGYFGTGAFNIFWIHRFTGPDLDPERQLDLISQILTQLNVQIAGVDYGGGFYQNDQLIRRFGPKKIMKYQYNPRQKKKIYWEPNLGRWMCHRSEVMSDVFNALKRQMLALPSWEDFREPYGSDILNIFSEYNERLRMDEYKHAPGKADDSFHSMLYCLLASMIQNPRPDIITPMKEDGMGSTYNG